MAGEQGETEKMDKADPGGSVCGILLVDKQSGVSSHDVVAQVRRLTGIQKVGHAGTLDPFATGLLLILVGKATRLFDLLAPLEKQYLVTMQFGAVSTTGDVDGKIVPVPGRASKAGWQRVLSRFTGRIRQQVPAYSAIKQNGERLYQKARRGQTFAAPVREVTIHDLKMTSFDEESQRAQLAVTCSKGTYIRRLCEDIGKEQGTGAYALSLRRTAIGEFHVGKALTLEALSQLPRKSLLREDNPSFLSCLSALYFLPVRELNAKEVEAVIRGRPIEGKATEPVRLVHEGRLLAIYKPSGKEGLIRPLVVLA
jgi:tRNA pseudouridine55 synthase